MNVPALGGTNVEQQSTHDTPSVGILIVIILGLALAIGILILLLGLYVINRCVHHWHNNVLLLLYALLCQSPASTCTLTYDRSMRRYCKISNTSSKLRQSIVIADDAP